MQKDFGKLSAAAMRQNDSLVDIFPVPSTCLTKFCQWMALLAFHSWASFGNRLLQCIYDSLFSLNHEKLLSQSGYFYKSYAANSPGLKMGQMWAIEELC